MKNGLPIMASASKPLNGPIKWHGGKHYLAAKIVALMPPHLLYVVPFFDGGSVLLAKNPEGVSEVVNDLDGNLLNFWKVMGNEGMCRQFHKRIEATPFSEAHWQQAQQGDQAEDDGMLVA